MRFWIGARGADMRSEGRGITAVTAGEADSPLAGGAFADLGVAVEAPSPTWLAPHPHHEVVYAALEGAGQIAAYLVRATRRSICWVPRSKCGDGVCTSVCAGRIASGRSSLGDGRVVHVPLRGDGSLGEPSHGAGRPTTPCMAPGGMSPDAAPSTGVPASSAQRARR